jgi:steroid delta-isomerase-like uncharacterized protein
MSTNDEKAAKGIDLLRRSLDAFNRGDIEACAAVLASDFIANVPGAPEPGRGRQAWKQNALMFREAFPDLRIEIDDIFGAGDRIAVRLTFNGTHKGDFLGIPATGRPVAFTSIEIYRVDGDELAEEWVSPDVTALMGQITST